jgi:hypothetical protein
VAISFVPMTENNKLSSKSVKRNYNTKNSIAPIKGQAGIENV